MPRAKVQYQYTTSLGSYNAVLRKVSEVLFNHDKNNVDCQKFNNSYIAVLPLQIYLLI